jgi:2-oxoglutarate ferredoxin oxidoreductase subunit gamma
MEDPMTEIRLSGFGGQGIIRMGYIIGKAASIFDGKSATMTQSFGPEARGSACSSQVVLADDRVLYPYVSVPHILVSMSQEAYTKFESNLDQEGFLLIDEDLVKPGVPKAGVKAYSIPSTRIAEEMGNKIIANIVMLGFFTAVTGVISADSVRKAIPGSVPQRFVDLNVKAFEKGYEYGQELLSKEEKLKDV